MSLIYNIYCDESCHLEHDHQPIMILGAISCLLEKTPDIAKRIREIKQKHRLHPHFEIKWTKVSPAKVAFYLDIIDYFFDNDELAFRALIVKNKEQLAHHDFNQDHDLWYYKMYFVMLKAILDPEIRYRIYLDIKDTCGGEKIRKLHNVLSNNLYDFSKEIVERIQLVRSDEIEILQVCDLLIGAVSYINRALNTSTAKLQLIERIRERSGYSLVRSTLLKEHKLNLFVWSPNWSERL